MNSPCQFVNQLEVKGTHSRLQFDEALHRSHHHPPSQANPMTKFYALSKENTKTVSKRQIQFGMLKLNHWHDHKFLKHFRKKQLKILIHKLSSSL